MNEELIKVAVSNYLLKNGYEVLDLFFKMPCDECITLKNWDKFILLPDLLLKYGSDLFLSFIIINFNTVDTIQKFILEYSDILPFKSFLVENNKLYEINKIRDLSDKMLLTDELDFKKRNFNGKTLKTYKSEMGEWGKKRKFGLRGEAELNKFLKRIGAKVMDLNFNVPCDNCSDIQNWRKYNKLPDGIAKLDNEVFFYDSKAKSGRYFIVNERDYKEYQDKVNFLPIKIYLILFGRDKKTIKEIYVHKVNFKSKPKTKEWDKNIVVDLSNDLEQVY